MNSVGNVVYLFETRNRFNARESEAFILASFSSGSCSDLRVLARSIDIFDLSALISLDYSTDSTKSSSLSSMISAYPPLIARYSS